MKISELISRLGGAPKLAKQIKERFGETISSGTVYRWGDRNTVSFRWRPFVAILAKEANLPLPEELQIYSPGAEAPKKGAKKLQLTRALKTSKTSLRGSLGSSRKIIEAVT